MTRTDSGLYYKIIDQGSERKIKYKDQVHFKYKGTLKDGTVFDDQMEAGQTFHVSELIAAWKEVMMELGEGGKCSLISPPQLGYGNYDLEKIPPNSILIYELEIIEVR
jgi:FKBP-type peptidyl-prolyl cis-trans isomerase